MRRVLAVLLVALLVVAGGCTVGFDAVDEQGSNDELESTDGSESGFGDTTGTLEIHHLDVGQADATFVRTPADETILIDSGDWRNDGDRVIEYLESQGVERIDHLIATHGHADHIGGHAAVIEHFATQGDGVGAAYDSGVVHTSQTYGNYLDAIEAYDVPLYEVEEGDVLAFEGAMIDATVVNPPGDGSEQPADLHYNSIALTIEYGEFAYLTTGDAEGDAERRLVENWTEQLDVDAYQAGHHGSSTSSTDPFLDAVRPEIAIVSSALESQYGHPHDEVFESFADRGIETYWTGVHGTVVLETDGETISVATERSASTDPKELLAAKHAAQSDDNEDESLERAGFMSDAERIDSTPSVSDSSPTTVDPADAPPARQLSAGSTTASTHP